MELKPSLETRPQLALSPRLYQSLNILRLSASDLSLLIQTEIETNPALEIPEPDDFGMATGEFVESGRAEVDLWRDMEAANRDDGAAERRDPFRPGPGAAEHLAASRNTLEEHLLLQLNLERLSSSSRRDALAVIASLESDGFLREDLSSIAEWLNRPRRRLEAALSLVQRFDPCGVGARSLQECLLLQLEPLRGVSLAKTIVQDHLELVASNSLREISKALGVPLVRVERAVSVIRGLDPAPGMAFDMERPAARVIPDVYVNIVQGRVQALSNVQALPRLKVNRVYKRMVEAKASKSSAPGGHKSTAGEGRDGTEGGFFTGGVPDEEALEFLRHRVRAASGLVRDIEKRRETLLGVATAIAEAQPEFFQTGPAALKPLMLDQVASRLEVHPSTVSRAILGKYMSTPFGIFELRYFFSAGYSRCGADDIAAAAVRQHLKRLVEAEDRRKPLSDQKLCDLLKGEGIQISRRTVTKYREELGIGSSRQRGGRS